MVESKKAVKRTFFSGVLLLTLSTLLVKVVGLVYKIPMLSYLGAVGMGYFHSAYELYALFCVIATAGLPVALSVLISSAIASGEGERVGRIYRASMAIFVLVGLLGSGLMVLLAPMFCRVIKSENAYAAILAISPTVFFVCVASALRGYFQGYQKMLQTAVSQLLEAIGKLVFGLLLARWALQRGMETPMVAAAAGVGLTAGTLLSLLYLLVEKLRFREKEAIENPIKKPSFSEKYRDIWKNLGKFAIPMTVGASAVSLTKLIDMTMILRRLQSIGYSETAANAVFGSYTTLALSVFALLPTLVNSVALPLVPMLSAAIASGDREKQRQMIQSSYQLTSLFAVPASLGVAAFARPILLLLFANEPETVEVAAPLLSMLGVSVFLSCMITATNSVLHAYRSVNRPILSMLAGSAVKVLSAYVLIGNPKIGLYGAPISTFLCNLTVVGLNAWFALRVSGATKVSMSVFLRPFVAAMPSVAVSYSLYTVAILRFGEKGIFTLAAILLTCLLYLFLSCRLRALEREDILALPMGERLYRLLSRLKWIPREIEREEK